MTQLALGFHFGFLFDSFDRVEFTGFYLVLPSFTEFQLVFTGFYLVYRMPHVDGVLPSFYRVLPTLPVLLK